VCPQIAVATGLVDLDGGEGRVRSETTCWDLVRHAQRKAGRVFSSGEDQFAGVELAATLSAPSLRTWRTACPAAPVWHGQSLSNQCAPHILAVDEQRATKPAKITLICTFGSGSTRTCHAFKFYRCRIPHQLAQTRRCAFPDLTLCSAGRPPRLRSIESDKAYVRRQPANVDGVTVDDPHIA
jgi:hypothetical protein